MKFSTTHGPSASRSTLQRTQLGSVGSFSLTLYHMSPDVPNCPLSPQAPSEHESVAVCWRAQTVLKWWKVMKGTNTDLSMFLIFLLNLNGLKRGEWATPVRKVAVLFFFFLKKGRWRGKCYMCGGLCPEMCSDRRVALLWRVITFTLRDCNTWCSFLKM